MIADLRKTLASANKSLSALESSVNSAGPAINTLTTETLPEFNQLARDVRQLSQSMKSITERIDQQGVGGLVGAPPLPDYDPGKTK